MQRRSKSLFYSVLFTTAEGVEVKTSETWERKHSKSKKVMLMIIEGTWYRLFKNHRENDLNQSNQTGVYAIPNK